MRTRSSSLLVAILVILTSVSVLQARSQQQAVSAVDKRSNADESCSAPAGPRILTEVNEQVRVALHGNVHPLAQPQYDRGTVNDNLRVEHMILVLQRSPAQETALNSRIAQMHNPGSANFHQWLTAEGFGQCYGVADSDISKVTGWLQSHGFQIDSVAAGKMSIMFSGTAGQVRNTFRTEIHNLNVRGEEHIGNLTEPQVPAALAPVIAGFRSLNNFFPKPLVHVVGPMHREAGTGKWQPVGTDEKTPASRLQAKGNGPGPLITVGGYWAVGPQDFYTIYNENPLLTGQTPINGAGQTLAIVQSSDVNPADVTTFRSQFGLPAYPQNPNHTQGGVNYLHGINGYCSDPGVVEGIESEADIDVQWMGAAAPAAIIDLVSCGDTQTTWGGDLSASYIVNSLASTVSAFSVSFGVCEAQLPNYGFGTNGFYNSLWQQAVAEGQTPVIAAGDSGDDTCDRGNGLGPNGQDIGATGLSVSGLASTPYNVAAGGTDFSDTYQTNFNPINYWNSNDSSPYGSALSYVPERTWNDTCGSTVLLDLISYADGITYPNGSEGLCNDFANWYDEFTFLDGGGGGISGIYSLPDWQSVYGVGLSGNYTSTSKRNLPDVSLFAADGFWSHFLVFCESDLAPCDYSNQDDVFAMAAGGTSFVAPQFGGILGLINQVSAARQGQANYNLYALASQEYGTRGAPNTSTTAPSLYTCEASNVNAISTYAGIFPSCTFYNLNRTAQYQTNSCLGGNNNGCLVDNNDQPCLTGSPNCYTNTGGDAYGLLSASSSTFQVAFPQSAGYNAAIGLGSFNVANLVTNWNNTQGKHTVTISVLGAGTVSSTDGLINCPGTCSHSYPANAQVTLNATPSGGSSFNGWSGGGCSGTGSCQLTVSQNLYVTANFTAALPTLTVTISGNGTVTSTDGFINCPGTCSHSYPLNTQVTLNATPASGQNFNGWSGACSGTGSCSLIMTQDVLVTAAFSQVLALINVGNSPGSLVVNPATNQIFVANDCGDDPTCQSGDGSVTVINGATLQTQTVTTADSPYPIAINTVTNKAYAATCDSDTSCETGTLSIVDGNTLAVQTIGTGYYSDWVAVNPMTNRIYVVNNCGDDPNCASPGTVSVIDGVTLAMQTVAVGYNPYSVTVNSVTNKIYVVNECGADPNCASPGTLTVIDGITLAAQTVNLDYEPLFAAVNSVTNKIYVPNNGGTDGSGNPGTVTAIDGATLATQRVQVQVYPAPVVVNAVTNKIYVGNRCGNDPNCIQPPSASVIDGNTLGVTNVSICAGETFPSDFIDLDPVTNTVFLPCNGRTYQGTTGMLLTELDGATNNTTSVAVGNFPNAAAVDAPSNRIYVANAGDATVSVVGGPKAAPVQFVSLPPCRVVDTRPPHGSGPIPGGTSQSFIIPGAGNPPCAGIASNAVAFSLNVTIVPTRPLGYLTIWPTGEDQPVVSTLNSQDGRVKANAAIVPAGYQGAVSVYVTDASYLILDIDGYFVPQGQNTLQFYPLMPCRVVDTRDSTKPQGLGPPSFATGETRPLPVLSSTCLSGINNALAYSFNATVVPSPAGQPLNYLTLWPTGQTQPVVSTLNNPTATVVANGAIVPAGTSGEIDAYTYNSTDLIIDVNGYFAAPGQSGYSLYPAAPCRVSDSRSNGGQPFSGERTVDVVDSPCAPPSDTTGYVLNATVVPSGVLGYLTLWPDSEQQPVVSTLNAYDRLVTSNLAIVPNLNGSIDSYLSDMGQLILDISGYFAPESQDLAPHEGSIRTSPVAGHSKAAPHAMGHAPAKFKMRGKGAGITR